jgi:16S rRNA (guanine527-N7)-methyltransferase
VAIKGSFISYKGPDVGEELAQSEKAVKILGGKVKGIRKPDAEGFGFDHSLVVIEKIKTTPLKYPRKAGVPEKEPLGLF